MLSEYWRFLRYGIPPNSGGQRDQPAGWFDNAELLHRVYNAHALYKQREPGHDAAWIAQHPDEWRIIDAVRKIENG